MQGIATALVVASIALISNPAFAQGPGRLSPGTGIVTGSIQIDGGGSMAGVRVAAIAVDDSIGANLISLTETDASGRYRLTNVPQGHYYVVAGRVSSFTFFPGGGERTAAKEVVVEPARTVSNIDFKVPADSRRPPPVQSTLAKSAVEFTSYQRASNEGNLMTRIKLLLNFEKSFPQSALLPRVYEDLVELYVAKGDLSVAMSYGDRLLEMEPENVWALLKVSQAYGLAQTNLGEARRDAEKAVATVTRLKALSYAARPSEFRENTPGQWASMMAALDVSAGKNLEWVRQVIVWHQNAIDASVRSRR